jgi:transposase
MLEESKILELIKRHKKTGLSVTAFCSNEGIHKSTFYYWRKKLNKEPENRFIPLLVNSRPAAMNIPAKDYTQEQIEPHNSGDDFLFELIYPNGTRLRIKRDPDLDHIRSLVCLLG